jgi:hypothetical protein
MRKVDTNDCWLFAGSINFYGYGVIFSDGKVIVAHRAVYEHFIGLQPKELLCDHLCRVRSCINPDHIEMVDNATNILRGEAPSAKNARKTECLRGHPFDEENTCILATGSRRCRKCMRVSRNRSARKRCSVLMD